MSAFTYATYPLAHGTGLPEVVTGNLIATARTVRVGGA